jgi:hypothetical protein
VNYRIYYNRTAEFPQVWSIDEGEQTSEINVSGFRFHGVTGESHYDADILPNRNTPTAWIEINYATLKVEGGIAHFFHDHNWREPNLA